MKRKATGGCNEELLESLRISRDARERHHNERMMAKERKLEKKMELEERKLLLKERVVEQRQKFLELYMNK